MNEADKKEIQRLCRTYGDAKIVAEITRQAIEECATTYANNQGAIIHKDTKTLQKCVKELARNHPFLGTARLC